MKHFKHGDIVKHSKHYFSVLSQAGCTEKSMKFEREMKFRVCEIPAKHGTIDSVGISPLDDNNTIIACTKEDIVLLKNDDIQMEKKSILK
jgi:hypothetical protein